MAGFYFKMRLLDSIVPKIEENADLWLKSAFSVFANLVDQ
jgi:hypothetical protein